MTGNTRISAIAFAAALGTLLATSQGATAGAFSPVMPGNDVQVDLGVLDQLDRGTTNARPPSAQNTPPRIEIDSHLVIYPRTAPKSRFLAPQLLLTPPSDTSRIGYAQPGNNEPSDDMGTVIIDGAGIVPSENAPVQRSAIKLRPPQERIHLRPPVSYPARPAVERIEQKPVSQKFSSRGNLGGSVNNQDLEDDGANQVVHLVHPKPHNVDGLPRNRPTATPVAIYNTTKSPKNQQVAAQKPAVAAASASTSGTLVAENDAKPAVVPAAPTVAKPKAETQHKAPQNKMPVPDVKKAPLPESAKPAPAQPATGPATSPATAPQPLTKDNAVKPVPSPAPDTTTPPQKMPDQSSRTMPKPPAPKKTVAKSDPAPEPRVKPHIQPRETASAPASVPAPKATSAPAGGDYSLPFAKNSFELDRTAKKSLDKVIGNLAKNSDLRVQLQAYAEGESQNASKARRLSLSRALQVRSYLIDGGVRSTRIDVRALGANVPSGPADRVDVKTVQR